MQATVRYPTLVDVALPRLGSRAATIARDVVLVAAGTGLVAACALSAQRCIEIHRPAGEILDPALGLCRHPRQW